MCRGTIHKSLPQSANVANAKSRSTSCEADISVPCDCHGNSHSLVVGCTSPDGAIAVQGARQCGVHRQPDPSEQPIDSTSASFGCDGCVEVQVTQQHVCTHTATASADSSHLSPEQTPSSQDPCPCAGSAVMAMSIEWAEREGELKATQQEKAEMVETQSRDPTCGTCRESQTTPGPTLGSQQSLCLVCESREDANKHYIPTRILPLRSLQASLVQPRLAKMEVQNPTLTNL